MPRLGAVATSADARCDAFWTMMNGGVCSDSMGQYLRPDGTPVSFEELVAAGKPADENGTVAKFIVAGSAILFTVVLIKAFRS